jgi:hypothetical protein
MSREWCKFCRVKRRNDMLLWGGVSLPNYHGFRFVLECWGPGPVVSILGRVKAPDVLRNSVRAEMPFLVPGMVGREIWGDILVRCRL